MSVRRCCPECFGDRGLREKIFSFLGAQSGQCDYCESSDVLLVEPARLATWFELLINAYEPSSDGKLLVDWMKQDWFLFNHPKMDIAHSKDLLSDILDDGDIVRKMFAPSVAYVSEGLASWETLRSELMYTNRWFVDSSIDLGRLERLLSYVISSEELPQKWFRARLRTDDEDFSIDKMGAPPKRKASHGRANPAGIPYLYLGSLAETAVAEMRPHTGEIACVADFSIPQIKAVDLRNPRELVTPFILEDAQSIAMLRADLPLLERLGEELTRPVLPKGAAIDYIPSQYLCEFIKRQKYDGVVYRSSVSSGFNLALFDPAKAKAGSVVNYYVENVTVNVTTA